MLLYFSILFGCLIISFGASNKNKKIESVIIFLLALFFCGGYMTGSDWRNYETYYSWIESGIGGLMMEPGYLYLSVIFYFLGISFWPFFIFLKVSAFYCLLHFLRKYSNSYHFLIITFFLFIFGLYLFIDNPMRNLLAICISYYSYQFLERKEWVKFFFIVVLAVSFHTSAILLLLICPFYPIKWSNKSLFLLFIVFNVIIVSFYEFLILKIIGSFTFIPIIEAKLLHYFIEGSGLDNNRLISLGFIVQLIFFLLVLYKRRQIEENLPFGQLVFWGTICYIFLYRIAAIVPIFYRLQLYMCVFYAVGVCYVFVSFVRKSNKILYGTFVVCYLFYMTYSLITSSYKFIPYTNHIQFINEALPYDYRSEYNHVNSPYEKNTKPSD